jgi:putative peptidoglycan lipid II flippase
MLAVALQRDGLLGFDRRLLDRIARTALATAALGLALTAALSVTGSRPGPFGLAGLCGGGLAVYALAALATGALPVSSLRLLAGRA